MGASIGSENPGGRDVELNVVPFIDLMSCLTAFLLVTAVWSNYSHIPAQPRDLVAGEGTVDPVELMVGAVLLDDAAVYVGVSRGDNRHRLDNQAGKRNWDGLAGVLRDYEALPELRSQPIQIAASDAVPYQELITAMDLVREAGYAVAVTDPGSLHVRFYE